MSTAWKQNTWFMFHQITRRFDETHKDKYKEFFESFHHIIPCRICRNHFIQNSTKPGMTIQDNNNSERIFQWTIDLHNLVNKMHNKQQWDYNRASAFYNGQIPFMTAKMFIYEYILYNFRKGSGKTENLFKMLRSLAYIYPDSAKKEKLIDFVNKFDLNRDTMKKWILAYMIILKN